VEVMLSPARGWVPAVVTEVREWRPVTAGHGQSPRDPDALEVEVKVGVEGEGAARRMAPASCQTRPRMAWSGGDGPERPASWVPAGANEYQGLVLADFENDDDEEENEKAEAAEEAEKEGGGVHGGYTTGKQSEEEEKEVPAAKRRRGKATKPEPVAATLATTAPAAAPPLALPNPTPAPPPPVAPGALPAAAPAAGTIAAKVAAMYAAKVAAALAAGGPAVSANGGTLIMLKDEPEEAAPAAAASNVPGTVRAVGAGAGAGVGRHEPLRAAAAAANKSIAAAAAAAVAAVLRVAPIPPDTISEADDKTSANSRAHHAAVKDIAWRVCDAFMVRLYS
jgi:hypothetical protein